MKERKPNKGGGRENAEGKGNKRPIEEGHEGKREKMRKLRKHTVIRKQYQKVTQYQTGIKINSQSNITFL